jgi:hypothetical protein
VRHPSLGEQPVKYGELYKRLQADHTRKNQALARERENLQREIQVERERITAERQRAESIAAELLRRQGGQGGAVNDPFLNELSSAQYIDGKMAAKLVDVIRNQGFAPVVQAFKERDQIIQGMYNELLTLRKAVQEVAGRFGNQDFDSKINNWLKDGGYPPEAADLAKEIYLAYEGNDLDEEFPQIFAARWRQIQDAITRTQREKVDAARRAPRLPGRGGTGSPSKPIGLKGHEKARDVADSLWEVLQARGEE